MRVVAGEYGGRRLKALAGDNTRPTTDKVKGAIFNIIGPYFDGGVVLDLFSGSAGLAIEAVSRGMEKAYCVDRNYGAIQIIKENIAITKEPDKFIVKKMSADKALLQFAEQGCLFDLVLLDPPYAQQQIIKELANLLTYNLLNQNALIVCEVDKKVDLPDEIPGYNLKRRQVYGISEVVIYQKL